MFGSNHTARLPRSYNNLARLGSAVVLGISLSLLQACGGGGASDSTGLTSSSDSGTVAISLQDAAGDFLAYSVNVTSLKLTKANGTAVETAPLSSQIDFAQYSDLSEFFTAATIPQGTYTKVQMVLDYSNANIVVEDASGNPLTVPAANIVDSNGNPLTTVTMDLNLDPSHPLVVVPGVPASLLVDFDLSATNSVTFPTTTTAQVEVEPFLTASLSLDTSRDHRARGLLSSVDTSNQSFNLALHPFHLLDLNGKTFGKLTVHTSDSTQYEINGAMYSGNAGLTAMAALATDTPVVAKGTVAVGSGLTATSVLAGTSVPWDNQDVVTGNVTARSGNSLHVRGSLVSRTSGLAVFHSDIVVNIDANTPVRMAHGSPITLTSANISVGQAITALGLSSVNGSSYTLDSTAADDANALVRMDLTQVKGQVLSVSPLTLDLSAIDGRDIGIFDFTGTGATQNSNPSQYQIDTGSLSLSNINLNDVLRVRGDVAGFGEAQPDFYADTVIDLVNSSSAYDLIVNYTGGSTSPFVSTDADDLVLNLSGTSYAIKVARIDLGIQNLDQLTLTHTSTSGNGLYVIRSAHSHAMALYASYADFVTALNQRLGSGEAVERILAHGRYTGSNSSFAATVVTVLMQ